MPSESSKKRTSERQLTKDDRPEDEDENEEDQEAASGSFQRASEDTLKARRIVKVARTATGEVDLSKKANPFSAVKLAPTGNGSDGRGIAAGQEGDEADADETTDQAPAPSSSAAKVFGAVAKFSGFGTATATSSSSDSKTTGGFAFTGFGSTGTSSSGLGFGSAKGFGEALSAGFASSKTQSLENASSIGEIQNLGKSVVQLPEHYDLKSGEEDEVVLFEKRCKAYRWAKVTRETIDNGATNKGAGIHAVPHAMTAFSDKGKSPGEQEDERAEASKADNAGEQFEWVEVGIGPMKILRHVETDLKRLVQRRQPDLSGPITKVIVNMGLPISGTVVTQPSEKHVQVSTVASGMYLFKFKLTSEATSFKHVLDENLAELGEESKEQNVENGDVALKESNDTSREAGTVGTVGTDSKKETD